MPPCYPNITLSIFFLSLFFLTGIGASAQSIQDTIPSRSAASLYSDSLKHLADTLLKKASRFPRSIKNDLTRSNKNKLEQARSVFKLPSYQPKDSSFSYSLRNPFNHLLITRPALRFTEGYVNYNFNYRSNIDTPYVEKDVAQHNVIARLNMIVGGFIPLQVSYWGRRSNSIIFQDISDVQVSFSGAALQQQLQSSLRNRLMALAPSLRDSLTEKLYQLKSLEHKRMGDWLQNPLQVQRLIECNEILRVPHITYDPSFSDSTNQQREDSIKKEARLFMDLYSETKERYGKLQGDVDSLRMQYDQSLQKVRRFRELAGGGWHDYASYSQWKKKVDHAGLPQAELPAKYRWLLGVKNFSAGRSVVNYSDLTAKNISLNGVNFEYNSWYYLAVAAGMIDYRFRDFVVNGIHRTPQFMYVVRAGIGSMEGNHFIVSTYQGKKQLFAGSATTGGVSSIAVKGVGAEVRMQLNRNSYLSAEVAQSISPDYRSSPPEKTTSLGLSDKTNQAYAIKLYSWMPRSNLRLEGLYKYTGANFQSFSSFQTNAALESWYIKADKSFWKRKLRITAALRRNDFSNPYIPQNYSSHTTFKTFTASWHARHWPVIQVGYLPMSQFTVLGNTTIESRFQTLNASLYHQYKVKQLRTATTFMYNRFYNTNTDTSYLYYNAINIYGAQSFFFHAFTATVAFSHTNNPGYMLDVMDENIQWNLLKFGSVGGGVKISHYNQLTTKVGGYVNANIRVGRQDMIYLSYERGYLPGYSKGLVRNEMANIQYTKAFRFR